MASLRRQKVRGGTAFELSLVIGLLLAGGIGAAAWRTTEPVAASVDVPILVAAPFTTTTTTIAASPSSVPTPPPPTPEPRMAPVAVPKAAYAPEPVQEIGAIEIPKIGLRSRIMNGITMRNIDLGPSHWPGTAMPGEVGNTVFAGHRTTKTRPFRDIDKLVPGDQVLFDVAGVRSTYVVTGSKIVLPTALEIVDPTPTATGTLFACHPPGSAKFRYVVLLALEDVQSG